MRTLKIIGYLIGCYFIHACSSIPASTSTLTEEILKQADDMHTLNIALVNQLYNNRKEQVNTFITNQYTPKLLSNFESKLPDTVDYKKELPNILNSIVPIINQKKDSIQNIINTEQQQIITKLNNNYSSFKTAGNSLQNLVNSAVKLRSQETSIVSDIQSLTNSNVNITNIESSLDSLLLSTGTIMDKVLEVNTILNQQNQ